MGKGRAKTGKDEDSCCCCATRIFLVIVGAIAIAFFSLALAMHFVKFDAMKAKLGAKDSNPVFYASLSFVILMIVAHIFLVVGALLRNRLLLCIFLVMDTILTIVLLALFGLMVATLTGDIDSKEFDGAIRNKLYECKGESDECKEQLQKESREAAIIFGVLTIIPTLVLYVVITITTCMYRGQIEED